MSTPCSVFQDGSEWGARKAGDKELQVRSRRRDEPRAGSNHDRRDGITHGISTARALAPPHHPHRSETTPPSIDRLTGVNAFPHPTGTPSPPPFAPTRQFQALFDSLFKVLFIFSPRGLVCYLLTPDLALDGSYRPIGLPLSQQPTRSTAGLWSTGFGTTGLSPSPAPPFQGTWARSVAEGKNESSISQTTIRTAKQSDFPSGLFPARCRYEGIL
ncbi:hypothetical protein Tco_0321415 [Tanacetum coccineum]